jgi:hypothetical protein
MHLHAAHSARDDDSLARDLNAAPRAIGARVERLDYGRSRHAAAPKSPQIGNMRRKAPQAANAEAEDRRTKAVFAAQGYQGANELRDILSYAASDRLA